MTLPGGLTIHDSIDLPDAMAQAAREAGLLTRRALVRLLRRSQAQAVAADSLLVDRPPRGVPPAIEPMSDVRINQK